MHSSSSVWFGLFCFVSFSFCDPNAFDQIQKEFQFEIVADRRDALNKGKGSYILRSEIIMKHFTADKS